MLPNCMQSLSFMVFGFHFITKAAFAEWRSLALISVLSLMFLFKQ